MNSSYIDHTSKSIDFIVANYEADAVHLYAFDTTISKSPAIVLQKIIKFLSGAVKFADFN